MIVPVTRARGASSLLSAGNPRLRRCAGTVRNRNGAKKMGWAKSCPKQHADGKEGEREGGGRGRGRGIFLSRGKGRGWAATSYTPSRVRNDDAELSTRSGGGQGRFSYACPGTPVSPWLRARQRKVVVGVGAQKAGQPTSQPPPPSPRSQGAFPRPFAPLIGHKPGSRPPAAWTTTGGVGKPGVVVPMPARGTICTSRRCPG